MDNGSLRAAFYATLDDFVDLNTRLAKGSAVSRRIRIRECMLTGAIGGIAFYLVISPDTAWPLLLKLSVTAVVAIALGALTIPLNRLIVNSRVRRLVSERFAGRNVVECIFEIRENGFWFKQDNVEVLHEWADIKNATESDGDVVVLLRSGMAIIRQRAFASASERKEFVDALKRHMQGSVQEMSAKRQ
jgi:hypothetical protein